MSAGRTPIVNAHAAKFRRMTARAGGDFAVEGPPVIEPDEERLYQELLDRAAIELVAGDPVQAGMFLQTLPVRALDLARLVNFGEAVLVAARVRFTGERAPTRPWGEF